MYLYAVLEPLAPPLTGDSLFAIEFRLILAALLIAFAAPNIGANSFHRLEDFFGRLARRQGLAVVVIGASSLIVRLALLPWLPIPSPGVPDEFSYLLQGDTFAHGRLTNPTPPLWKYYDTLHVLLHPTYASKYPPMQGIALAIGEAIFGHPWFGVLLSVAAMCAAITWMLQGWLPPSWALLGGALAIIRLGTFSYWINSYWGGAMGAIGGALVLGSLPRIVRRHHLRQTWVMGLGVAVLANNRPFEGFVMTLPVMLILLAWVAGRKSPPWAILLRNVVLPLGICVVGMAGAMAYYNWRVTGSSLLLPYEAHIAQYGVTPLFLWQPVRSSSPAYSDPLIQTFHLSVEPTAYRQAHSLDGFVHSILARIEIYDFFYLGPVLTIPLLTLPWMTRDSRIRPLLWIGSVVCVGLATESWYLPHYASPVTALIYALVLQGMRHLRVWRIRHRWTGQMMVRAIPLICLIMFAVRLGDGSSSSVWAWYSDWPGNKYRAQIVAQLKQLPGPHLVLVKYGPKHSSQDEWVYNGADIENAPVIWARDKGNAADRSLIDHFPGRRVWILDPDQRPVQLAPLISDRAGLATSSDTHLRDQSRQPGE